MKNAERVAKRIYLDSNVYISLVREEIDKAFNLRFKDAELFLSLCRKEEIILILSYLFFDEIKKVVGLKRKDIIEFFKNYGIKIEIFYSKKDYSTKVSEIYSNFNLHYPDSLHVAIAIDTDSDLIVSWNKKDFIKTNSLIKCLTPKEFIEEFY